MCQLSFEVETASLWKNILNQYVINHYHFGAYVIYNHYCFLGLRDVQADRGIQKEVAASYYENSWVSNFIHVISMKIIWEGYLASLCKLKSRTD
jgi:hypothetical protein